MQQIDQKITAIINHFQLNNYAFSKRIGVTGTTIDSIVNGRPQPDGTRKKTKPGYDVLSAIIDQFNINPDYLFGKSDVMLKQDVAKIQTYSGVPQVVAVNQNDEENVMTSSFVVNHNQRFLFFCVLLERFNEKETIFGLFFLNFSYYQNR